MENKFKIKDSSPSVPSCTFVSNSALTKSVMKDKIMDGLRNNLLKFYKVR